MSRRRCRCGARWGGDSAAHCPACHRTFTSNSGFDRHLVSRRTAGCHDPATLMTEGDQPRRVFQWDPGREMWRLAPPPGRRPWPK